MAKVKCVNSSETTKPRRRPAMSPEAREQQLTALAMDLVEQRLRDGTASSQETTHFLKLASTKANLEREKLRYETELIKSKKESLDSARRSDAMYEEVMEAIKRYQGINDETEGY